MLNPKILPILLTDFTTPGIENSAIVNYKGEIIAMSKTQDVNHEDWSFITNMVVSLFVSYDECSNKSYTDNTTESYLYSSDNAFSDVEEGGEDYIEDEEEEEEEGEKSDSSNEDYMIRVNSNENVIAKSTSTVPPQPLSMNEKEEEEEEEKLENFLFEWKERTVLVHRVTEHFLILVGFERKKVPLGLLFSKAEVFGKKLKVEFNKYMDFL